MIRILILLLLCTSLFAVEDVGSLVILGEPIGASVHIDDKYVAMTPTTGHDFILEKEYRIVISNEGYKDFDTIVTLQTITTDTLQYKLKPQRTAKESERREAIWLMIGALAGFVGGVFVGILAEVGTSW